MLILATTTCSVRRTTQVHSRPSAPSLLHIATFYQIHLLGFERWYCEFCIKKQTLAVCSKLLSQNRPVALKESCMSRDIETRWPSVSWTRLRWSDHVVRCGQASCCCSQFVHIMNTVAAVVRVCFCTSLSLVCVIHPSFVLSES